MAHIDCIAPEIFEKRSLKQTLDDLLDPNVLVTYDKLINLVVKYFFAYRYPESHDAVIHLSQLNELVQKALFYFQVSREFSGRTYAAPQGIDEETFGFFNAHGYSTSMLGDVAATTMIVREIVRTVINRNDFHDTYVGLDMGSGSGILSLAAYICAQRNKFGKRPLILCVEREQYSLQHSQKILDILAGKDVFCSFPFDTTDAAQMRKLVDPKGSVHFAHVINENITTSGVPMSSGPDPFHPNNQVLFGPLSSMISPNTQFFPAKILMLFSTDGGKTGRQVEGNSKNSFGIKKFLDAQAAFKADVQNGIPSDWSIFEHVFPLGIQINGGTVPMHEVGQELYKNGSVRFFPEWRHRWSARAIGNNTSPILLPE